MRYVLVLLGTLVLATACTKTGSTISPLAGAVCAVETTVAGAEGGAIATLLTCSNTAQIQTDLMTALGNANLCAQPIPAPAAPMPAMSKDAAYKTIGDVPDSALHPEIKSQAAKPMGVVAIIACPIVVNVAIGYATQAIPSSWGCAAGASAQSLATALTTACEAAVPL